MSRSSVTELSINELMASTSEDVVKPMPIGKKAHDHHGHGHSHGHGHAHGNGHANANTDAVAFRQSRQMSCYSYRYSIDGQKHSHCIEDGEEKEIESSDGSQDGHEHSHAHGHSHSPSSGKKGRRAEKVLWVVAVLSAIFIAAELTGGIIAKSLAIATDAMHMLSDLLSFIISIAAIRCSRMPANKRMSFGYDRAEVLGAMVSILILWVLTTVLVILAIERIVHQVKDINANVMLITACCGIGFNIIMAVVLHFGSKGGAHLHSHGGASHGHSHGDGTGGVNVRAALIHVIGDFVQSIGVLIAALVIKFTGWTLADPICTFFFSIIVLFTTITVARDIFVVLMEGAPRGLDINEVKEELTALEGVIDVHDLHIWAVSMNRLAFSVHLSIDTHENTAHVVRATRKYIQSKFENIENVTIQVEPRGDMRFSCD